MSEIVFKTFYFISDDGDWCRASREHLLQALLLLRHRVSPPARERVRTTQGNDQVNQSNTSHIRKFSFKLKKPVH